MSTDAAQPTQLARTARKVLEAIEANPEAFYMSAWFSVRDGEVSLAPDAPVCGTTMCVAGWAAHLNGWTLAIGDDGCSIAVLDGLELTVMDAAIQEFAPANGAERIWLTDLFSSSTNEQRARAALAYVAEHGTFPPGGVWDDDALAPYWP
jgi:hypothetical protein